LNNLGEIFTKIKKGKFMKTIKQLRIEAGLTQKQLSERVGATRENKGYQGAISALERGDRTTSVKRLRDTIEALGYKLRLEAVGSDGMVIELDLGSLLGIDRHSIRAEVTQVKS